MKILHLTLKKVWFDLIRTGQKKYEYRLATGYWKKRILGKKFDIVRFRNGYRKDAPAIDVEFKDCDLIYDNHPETGKVECMYRIKLGKIFTIS